MRYAVARREVIVPPAWRRMDGATLGRAIALGEEILAGAADLHALDAASLAGRGKARTAVGPAGPDDPRASRPD